MVQAKQHQSIRVGRTYVNALSVNKDREVDNTEHPKSRNLVPRTHFHPPPSQRTVLLQSVTHPWVQLATPSCYLIDPSWQGTTGNPKGAVITQGALATSTFGTLAGFDIPVPETITLLSYLPLAHIYEVMCDPPFSDFPVSLKAWLYLSDPPNCSSWEGEVESATTPVPLFELSKIWGS